MKRYLVASLIIHLAVLLSLTFQFRWPTSLADAAEQLEQAIEEVTQSEEDKPIDNGDIIEKLEVTLVENQTPAIEPESEIPAPAEKPKPEQLTECVDDKWFGGIGVLYEDWRTKLVKEVYRGYPAYKAGVQPGDYLSSQVEITGEPGTPVTIEIFRPSTGETFLLELIRDKICTKERKHEQVP